MGFPGFVTVVPQLPEGVMEELAQAAAAAVAAMEAGNDTQAADIVNTVKKAVDDSGKADSSEMLFSWVPGVLQAAGCGRRRCEGGRR